MNDGYILLHRKITNWQWYSNKNDRLLFIHCLINANWKDGCYNGLLIPRGSFATGRKKLAKEIGLTEQQIRTSLEHLKSTNEITIKSYNKFSIITINNYNKYQTNTQQDNQQITNNIQKNNHNINNNKEINNINNKERNIKERIDIPDIDWINMREEDFICQINN